MRAKHVLSELTALSASLNVTIRPILVDDDDAAERLEPVLTDPLAEVEASAASMATLAEILAGKKQLAARVIGGLAWCKAHFCNRFFRIWAAAWNLPPVHRLVH